MLAMRQLIGRMLPLLSAEYPSLRLGVCRLLSQCSRQRERLSAWMLSICSSVCLFVCLSPKCNKTWFSQKTKQRTLASQTPIFGVYNCLLTTYRNRWLWTPAQRKRASMLYFADVFFNFFYGRLILRPWLTEVRERFTRGGPWVALEKLLLGFFPGHP